MEAIEKTILKIINDNVDFMQSGKRNVLAREIAEHLEEYDKWKLENCEPHYSGKWTLYKVGGDGIIDYFTNSELYQYYLDNVFGK